MLLLFIAADAKYQVVSAQHQNAEEQFNMANAELGNLVNLMEATTRHLEEVTEREEAAKEETEALPALMEELKKKMDAYEDLFDN